MLPAVDAIKENMNKFDHIKIENSCCKRKKFTKLKGK